MGKKAEDKVFGERLRELRDRAGLTQQQLADKAGLQVSAIRDLEQARCLPRVPTLKALKKALGVSCDELLEPAGKGE